jgi:DNA mismatch repair protein MutL
LTVNKDYDPFRETTIRHSSADWQSLYEGFESERNAVLSLPDREPPGGEWPVRRDIQLAAPEPGNTCAASAGGIFPDLSNPCFQYRNRYIITPLRSGLVIIDQHRAHVRILYEKYIHDITTRRAVSQKLLFPEMIELTASEASLLPSLTDEIKFLGFELVPAGGNTYAIHGTSADVAGRNPVALFRDILSAAIDEGESAIEKRAARMALSLAKATAIPVGKLLSADEMETLVASLFAVQSHGMTPDGLAVLTIITDDELAKRL